MSDARELRAMLERCHRILRNMAREHTTGWRSVFARWPISHEPLRADARNLLPEIERVLDFQRCDGCDGYDCITSCAYPGAGKVR